MNNPYSIFLLFKISHIGLILSCNDFLVIKKNLSITYASLVKLIKWLNYNNCKPYSNHL